MLGFSLFINSINSLLLLRKLKLHAVTIKAFSLLQTLLSLSFMIYKGETCLGDQWSPPSLRATGPFTSSMEVTMSWGNLKISFCYREYVAQLFMLCPPILVGQGLGLHRKTEPALSVSTREGFHTETERLRWP